MDQSADTPTDGTASPAAGRATSSPRGGTRKRGLAQSAAAESPGSEDGDAQTVNRRKNHKVSRACDHCKQRKAKCSGTLPCAKCSRKGLVCLYDARYSRGRPPTPPPSRDHAAAVPVPTETAPVPVAAQVSLPPPRAETSGLASRASPELGMAEIEGQVFDPTSGVTFLHRAWKRLARHDAAAMRPDESSYDATSVDRQQQPVTLTGDRPLPHMTEEDALRLTLPARDELDHLVYLYFDVCIATYRIVHRPSVEAWLRIVEANVRQGRPAWHEIGRARASIVLACLAVATAHNEKSRGTTAADDVARALARSDRLFCVAAHLTDAETGAPRLESAQTRIVQTLYLLTTSRMNRAWYTFGSALQLISALGLHRRTARKRYMAQGTVDYIQAQFRMRTFWTAYVLDKYLGVIFGRPRHYHDDDIDQDMPDRIEDDEMTPQGPVAGFDEQLGCHIDALIFHANIARITDQISREVYSIKPVSEDERVSAAHRLSRAIHEWKASLPPYLGTIRPSMLITSFRRQSTVLKLAHAHAMMHANRLFLLAPLHADARAQVAECVGAARAVFDTVDGLANDGPIFHAFWWTHYVTFCALVVSYVWDIQLRRRGIVLTADEQAAHLALMELARRCQTHLAQATATNSPSRRYAVILEEFRSEAMGQKGYQDKELAVVAEPQFGGVAQGQMMEGGPYDPGVFELQPVMIPADPMAYSLLDEWNTNDWLDLDASAFGPYMADLDTASLQWMPGMDM